MRDAIDSLTWLQHADSFFPSGAVSFSWGLETLAEDQRVVGAADVAACLEAHLHGRWASIDRALTIAAHRSAPDLDRIAEIDRLAEAQTLAAELRDGSRRIGYALLDTHRRLGTPSADAYRGMVDKGHAQGHGAVVQGLMWHDVGMDARAADAASAHQLCIAILGAALRLGLIGHIEAQRILNACKPGLTRILESDPPALDRMHAFTPEAEIAAMRHETQDTRLFAN